MIIHSHISAISIKNVNLLLTPSVKEMDTYESSESNPKYFNRTFNWVKPALEMREQSVKSRFKAVSEFRCISSSEHRLNAPASVICRHHSKLRVRVVREVRYLSPSEHRSFTPSSVIFFHQLKVKNQGYGRSEMLESIRAQSLHSFICDIFTIPEVESQICQ